MFLDAYIPRSFENSVDYFNTQGKFDFEVKNIPTELITAFNQTVSNTSSPTVAATPPSIQPQNPKTTDKSQWIWAIVNGSLLAPLFLALGIFYFAFVNLANERKEFQDLQKETINQNNERLKSYQKLEEKILEKISGDIDKKSDSNSVRGTK